uniref:hypothetical protein n=1 Tax=Cellvibrio fontiphilus TaxID=1815559 RepID=UPI002B4C15B4|nr:hypothetical protein [Cellvibrio fontiphilus]
MATEISLTESEIDALEKKLNIEKLKLPESEVTLIEAILKRAKEAKDLENIRDPGWYFGWTYRF